MSEASEYSPLLPNSACVATVAPSQHVQDKAELKVYKRRWYVLLVYGLVTMNCCAVWNTFSPISEVCERVFHWNTATLSLLANWGPIAYVISVGVSSWVLDENGLRPACVTCAFLIAVGTALRCISSDPSIATPLIHCGQLLNGLAGPIAMGGATAVSVTWLIHCGQLLNGLAGPIAMAGQTALSVTWFPPEQRATATATALNINTLGLAVSFLLGPYLVPVLKIETNDTVLNTTIYAYTKFEAVVQGNTSENHHLIITRGYDVDGEREALMRYMYYSCAWTVLCLVCTLVYFPNRPPKPPSPSASIKRVEYFTGVKKLARNQTFLLISLAYGLSFGIMDCWNGVLDVNLKDHNVSQSSAAWLGFYGVIGGIAAAELVARCADIFSKHLKTLLLALFVLSTVAFLLFAVSLAGIGGMPSTKGVLYPSYIGGNVLMTAASPLFYEAACEVTYPVAEGATTLVLTLVNNVAGLLFLLVQMVPGIGTMWENWCLVAAMVLCVPVLCLIRQSYNRLDIDVVARRSPDSNPDHPDRTKKNGSCA